MASMRSLKVSGYRCFDAEEPQGFDDILPINVIIGRNNVGKSSLLEVVKAATNRHQDFKGTLFFSKSLEEPDLAPFSTTTSGGGIPGANHHVFGMKYLGHEISWRQRGATRTVTRSPTDVGRDYWNQVPTDANSPLFGYNYYRLAAARDVTPHAQDDVRSGMGWSDSGETVTGVVVAFVNAASLPSTAVTIDLLSRLNEIVAPARFDAITVQVTAPDGKWHIFLSEAGKAEPIPLSDSGAGLKTILSVLTLFELIPRNAHGQKVRLNRSVFALEELENNLHPTLQRRLLSYIRQVAIDEGATIFLTTHSSVAIDLFEGDDSAQIVHVTHDGSNAKVMRVDSYQSYHQILDDLGAKASDLLQSNCVVWVEGPSDRIYFNRWMELWTDGEIREGAHYQCMFYGGALLAHVSAGAPDANPEEFVRLLRLNRNAIVLFDHDGESSKASLNAHKVRVLDELAGRGLGWVTAGREVENYIPVDILESNAGLSANQARKPFYDVPGALSRAKTDQGRLFRRGGKVGFAMAIRDQLTRTNVANHLDLEKRLDAVVSKIREWNSLAHTAKQSSPGQ